MANGSDIDLTPSQPKHLRDTPTAAPPAIPHILSHTGRSSRRTRSTVDSPSPSLGTLGDGTQREGGAGLATATPSFANRGFTPRFLPDEPGAGSAQFSLGNATTPSPLSSDGFRRRASKAPPQEQGGDHSRPGPTFWERHGRRLSAPSGVTETQGSEGPSPSFALQAPSGLTDSEEEDGEGGDGADSRALPEGGSRRGSGLGAGIRPLSPAELALTETSARAEAQLRVRSQLKLGRLERVLLEADVGEQAAQQAAQQAQQRDREAAEREEEAQRAEHARQRQQLLAALRAEHKRKAQETQQRLEREEAARREEAQRREREAQQAKQAAEAKAQRAAHQGGTQGQGAKPEAAASPAQAPPSPQSQPAASLGQVNQTPPPKPLLSPQAPQQQQQPQEQQKAAPGAPPPAADPFPLRLSPSAARWRQHCADRLKAAQEGVRAFVEDRAMRDKKRSIDKFVTLNVQQISATLDQVRSKGMALVQFVGGQQGAQRTYALLTLANKMVSQCEAQVTRLHSFAFPAAEVAVAVAAAHPDFVELLVGRLHQVCVLCVPGYYSFKAGRGEEDHYLKLMGYKFTLDEDTGKVSKESTDDFLGRMQGYVLLLAALTQSDNPHNPHGLSQAWTYLARLLNSLPANRITATALDAFLRVAGFRMHGAYRGQFMKLLQYIDREFLPDLSKQGDPDARAVHTRISTYLRTGRFRQPPEGRDMPRSDASSRDRA